MKCFLILVCCLTLFLMASAGAQQILTLRDFLSKVEKNNPEILAGRKQVESKEAMRKAAGAWEDPMGMFGIERMPTTYPASGSSSILVEDKLYAKNLGISQKLPFFGTLRQRKKIAGQEKLEAEFGFRQTRLEKLAEAKKAYWEWARLQKDRQLLDRAFIIWGKLVSLTQVAYSKAEGEHHAYLRAQVELVKLEAENLEISEALKKTAAWMAYLAGENMSAESLLAEPTPRETERPWPADSALVRAVENAVVDGALSPGPLGIGKGSDQDLPDCYPWPGVLDEIALYGELLAPQTLEAHLQALIEGQ